MTTERETGSQREAREDAAARALFAELRSTRPAHSAIVFALDPAGREFQARCQCGPVGRVFRYSGELPVPIYAVDDLKRRANLVARAHNAEHVGAPA